MLVVEGKLKIVTRMETRINDESKAKTLADLGLNEWLVNQCKALNMTKPTPIQLNCIPQILEGLLTCCER
jgi:superfamily II DNA/RNA helicase